MKNNREYQLCKQLSIYMKYQYPNVLYHFDPTGLNLSKAQSGMLKAIQHNRGFPDIVIYEPKFIGKLYYGLFLELKKEGTKIFKRNGEYTSEHISEQVDCLIELRNKGYMAEMVIGFDEAKKVIDRYLQ